jgi:adenosylcobinamide kinase/adenosylcobinamide-phosphate guanylyltransferase
VGRIILVTGGSRSGKSAHGLKLASEHPRARKVFIATAEALDEEMAVRISRHKAERAPNFTTIEEPLKLAEAVTELNGKADAVVIDSLTLWVSNLMCGDASDAAFKAEASALAMALAGADFASIVVTDEVGSGVVPDNPTGRRFRDLLGSANQEIARAAAEVILVVAGYPLKVK